MIRPPETAGPPRLARSRPPLAAVLALLPILTACGGEDGRLADETPAPADARETPHEARSLLGEPLMAPELPEAVRRDREARLGEAMEELERNPENADALIWLGRRLAYLGRYREAVDVYTRAMELHPEDARLYRHRGHRFLTLRRLQDAEADLEHAALLVRGTPDEVEPDGLPNPRGIPTSTLHFNIWYHLGLARYLQGDFEGALEAYRSCLDVSGNPDALVATSHWLYITLRRLGRDDEAAAVLAPVTADLDVIENGAYHDLLLLYRGERTPEDLLGPTGDEATLESTTTAYGVANWHLYNDRAAEAWSLFRRILEGRDQWAAFGYLAAEAELAREPGQGAAGAG